MVGDIFALVAVVDLTEKSRVMTPTVDSTKAVNYPTSTGQAVTHRVNSSLLHF